MVGYGPEVHCTINPIKQPEVVKLLQYSHSLVWRILQRKEASLRNVGRIALRVRVRSIDVYTQH